MHTHHNFPTALRAWRMTLAVMAIGLVVACSPNTDRTTAPDVPDSEDQQLTLTQWLDQQFEEEVLFSPIQLSFLGRKERNDEIDAFTHEALSEQVAWKAKSVAEMRARFDRASLTEDERLSYDLWIYQYESLRADEQFLDDGLSFDQMNGIQNFLPTFLINFHSVETANDMAAYIKRIEAVQRVMQESLANATRSSGKGVITHAFSLNGVIQQSQAVIAGLPFEPNATQPSDLWADVNREIQTLLEKKIIDAEAADRFVEQARSALLNHVKPAYEAIVAWAELELDKAPKVVTGVGAQPNGDRYYQHRLRDQTTTDLTADEIHQIGLDEVARLRAEMEEIKKAVGFDGDLEAFFLHIKNGDWNYYPNTDEGRVAYIDDSAAAIANIKDKLPDFFGLLPKADLVVKRVEPFRERDGAAQHYYPGTPDGARPGTYYAHLSDMTAVPKNQLEVIAYHEGLPGHHMQISIAQELTNVPVFRTQTKFTAYNEGWGLYSEYLAKEMPGTYADPYQDFGRLTTEIWRAIRLVVDTGLHAKGWTEQQAIDYFAANSPAPLDNIRSEVQRYIVLPGQATSYKIGMLKIQELRKKSEDALGEAFDIRTFHDAILGGGELPLPLLERKIDRWIADQLTAGA